MCCRSSCRWDLVMAAGGTAMVGDLAGVGAHHTGDELM